MKRKLINSNWFNQRKITEDTLKTSKNEAYINQLANDHKLPMSDLVEHCKMNVVWVPNKNDFDNRKS